MGKVMGIAAVAVVAMGVLTGCGGGDDAGAAESALPTMPVATATPSPTSAVETYCQQVDEYVQKAEELAASPTPGAGEDLTAKAQQLQDTAAKLGQELTDDPTQMTRVQECTTTLQEALAG